MDSALLRHLFARRGPLHGPFPPPRMAAIESAIREAEKLHGGEIRFAVEAAPRPGAAAGAA